MTNNREKGDDGSSRFLGVQCTHARAHVCADEPAAVGTAVAGTSARRTGRRGGAPSMRRRVGGDRPAVASVHAAARLDWMNERGGTGWGRGRGETREEPKATWMATPRRRRRWPCGCGPSRSLILFSVDALLVGLLFRVPDSSSAGWSVGQTGRALGAWASLSAEQPVQGPLATAV